MSYGEAGPDTVAFLGRTDDGLPEVVQFTYRSGRTVTAEYRGVEDRGFNGDDVVYDVVGYDTPLTMRRAAVDDAYDVAERLGEREGYQDAPALIDDDAVDPVLEDGRTASEQLNTAEGENTVEALLDDDRLDSL